MIYFYYGEDHASSLNALKLVIERFGASAKDRIPHIIDCEEIDSFELASLLDSSSLFHPRQLFVLKHFFKAPGVHRAFAARLDNLRESQDVVMLWERDVPEKTEFFDLVLKNSRKKEFKKTRVERATAFDERKVFTLADSWATGDKRNSISLFHSLIAGGIAPERVFWTLIWHTRNLLMIKDLLRKGAPASHIEKETKLHPFVVKKGIREAQSLQMSSIRNSFKALAAIDEKTKKGRAKLDTALLHFLITEPV